jgi:hypothetical protein
VLLEVVVEEVVVVLVVVVEVVVVLQSNFMAVVMLTSKLIAFRYFRYSRAVLYKWQKVGATDLKL